MYEGRYEGEERVAEVKDDYGTNPTHEPTENRRGSTVGWGVIQC